MHGGVQQRFVRDATQGCDQLGTKRVGAPSMNHQNGSANVLFACVCTGIH